MLNNSRNKFLILFLFISLTVSSNAQPNPTVLKILGISVQGNVTADPNTVIANTGLRIGDEIQIPGDKLISAMKQLWTLGLFSDIQIVEERRISSGVFLLIKVEEYPRVEKVIIQGEDNLREEDIIKQINFVRGQTLKPQSVQNAIFKIRALYEEDGYFNTEFKAKYFEFFSADSTEDELIITWRNSANLSEEYTDTYDLGDLPSSNFLNRVKVRRLLMIDITEREKVSVANIHFIDNDYFSDEILRGELAETSEKRWWKFWTLARFDKKKFEEDKTGLVKYYRSMGFRDAEVISDSIVYSEDKSQMDLYIRVFEGPMYKLRAIDWRGNTVYTDEQLSERLGFSAGDIYNYPLFMQNLMGNEKQSDIASMYLDNGYLTFRAIPTEKKSGFDSVDVVIQISENNQFKIGEIKITGNDKTKDKVIRRELFSIPGDNFARSNLIRSLQQLANLQYFNVEKLYQEGVNYEPVDDSTVSLVYKVEEKSSDYLNASVGYSGSFGFSGAIGITLTNFSITEPFQLGAGQVLSFNWQFGVGNLYRTFTLGFTEPWFMDTPTSLGFEFYDTRQSYYYDIAQTGGSVKVGRRLTWPDDYFYIMGSLRYQNTDVVEGRGYYVAGEQYSLGIDISRRNIDNPVFPSLGSNVAFSAEISGGPFLPGNVDYFKLGFKAEAYRRLLNTNKLSLYNSFDMGYIGVLNEASKRRINPFEKFWMGGSGMVIATTPLRGYDDRTVGPMNADGEVDGGNIMMKVGTELRYAVSLDPVPLYVLAFAEAGRVFEDLKSADLLNLRKSVGVGARIMINPIGLLGFDVGYGFDRKAVDGADPSWQFHFQFGKGF